MLDEIFDSSLDQEGIECLFKIIGTNEVKADSNIIIITHRQGFEDKFERNLVVEKSGNFSIIKEVSNVNIPEEV